MPLVSLLKFGVNFETPSGLSKKRRLQISQRHEKLNFAASTGQAGMPETDSSGT
jgi:hypothetical protein